MRQHCLQSHPDRVLLALAETLQAPFRLDLAGGAVRDEHQARAPAVVAAEDEQRVAFHLDEDQAGFPVKLAISGSVRVVEGVASDARPDRDRDAHSLGGLDQGAQDGEGGDGWEDGRKVSHGGASPGGPCRYRR